MGRFLFAGMGMMERISLRYFSGKYGEAEGAPGSVFEPGSWVGRCFCGVCDARRTEALLRERRSAFHYVQLLSAAAAVEERARAGHFRERVGESARRDGFSIDRLCGDAGACASVNERAEAGDAVDGATEIEAAGGAEIAEARKAGVLGADAIAVWGDGGARCGRFGRRGFTISMCTVRGKRRRN